VRTAGRGLEALENAVSITAGRQPDRGECLGALPRRPAGIRGPVVKR
jgi:hypothetical protein